MRSSIEALKGRESIAQGKPRRSAGKSAARRTPPWVHRIPHVRALKGRKRNGANSFSHTLLDLDLGTCEIGASGQVVAGMFQVSGFKFQVSGRRGRK